MILLPKIMKKDLDAFVGKKVIVCGRDERLIVVCKILKSLGIKVVACYNSTESVQTKTRLKYSLKCSLMNVRFFNKNELFVFVANNKDVMIQSSDITPNRLKKQGKQWVEENLSFSDISAGNLILRYSALLFLKGCDYKVIRAVQAKSWENRCNNRASVSWKRFKKQNNKNSVVICSPPKTADHSLVKTLEQLNRNEIQIAFTNLWHKPSVIYKQTDERYFAPLKILIGVREPIGQNVSLLYQQISDGLVIQDWVFGDLMGKSSTNQKAILEEYREYFSGDDLDVQWLWDQFSKKFILQGEQRTGLIRRPIQHFIPEFAEYVVDITAFPFNQEKGYTIIKEGNTEVFVYQLEKLNNLVLELSEWLGVSFDTLVRGNDASDKWIADSYKQAQKEIQITQEYFDRCFDEPYVKHCYSEEDIEKFKAKWKGHIK